MKLSSLHFTPMPTPTVTAAAGSVLVALVAWRTYELPLSQYRTLKRDWHNFHVDLCSGRQCDTTAVSLGEHSVSGRSVHAVRHIRKGDRVLLVDNSLILAPRSFPDVVGVSDPLLHVALGLAALAMGGHVAQRSSDRVALRWLEYNLQHAPDSSYASFSTGLAATFDSVEWLWAMSHSADSWPAFWELLRAWQPGADEPMARRVYAAVASRAYGLSLPHDGTDEVTVALVPMLDMVSDMVRGSAYLLACLLGE